MRYCICQFISHTSSYLSSYSNFTYHFWFYDFCCDLLQPYGIDVQAGEQKLLALAYSTLCNKAMTWLQHLLALVVQKHHAGIIILSGVATTTPPFCYGYSWTLGHCRTRLFLYLNLFCLLESPRQNHYQNSCRLSDPHIYLYILCQILSFSEYIQKCFQDLLLAKHSSCLLVILFQYFMDQVC